MQHSATNVAKEGTNEFSFKISHQVHRFQAATPEERDSWVVALQKQVEESAAIKDEIYGRESYKKTIDDFSKY